jgi:hypothetical protein
MRLETINKEEGEIEITIGNITGETLKAKGKISFSDGGKTITQTPFYAEITTDRCVIKSTVDISKLTMWSQFNPKLYNLEVKIVAGEYSDLYHERTGVRTVGRNAKNQFTVNGVPTFLRGTVNYNIFPITGYPSTKLEDWLGIFRIYKEWGMNHVRFHSLTPPRAAFQAADMLGIYLQCECPKAGVIGRNMEDDHFQVSEGYKILRDYGNHPSFILMSMGNELAGETNSINHIYDAVSSNDNRRLYTTTTGGASKEVKGDYKIYGGVVRGFKGAQTDWDYADVIQSIDATVISHEVGQWHVYPDISILPKFTGVMQADNLQIIKDDLEQRGLISMAADFTQLTGAFSASLYKEEMEAIMRTPNMGGYQILMLNDFPAQGTATCGMIDIFNDLKGYILPEQFREFVAPVVPLARMKKRVYTTNEIFTARIDLANYSEHAIPHGKLIWTIGDKEKVYYSGEIERPAFPVGNVFYIGDISVPLSRIMEPKKLELIVTVKGTAFKNQWNIWVYPDHEVRKTDTGVHVAYTWAEAEKMLAKGEKVLLLPSHSDVVMWRPGQFKSIFWSPVWLKRGIETMSVMADTEHPALAKYPTDRHTDWQWFDVLENSYVLAIDELPLSFKPIVSVIDGFRKNQRLANLLEARVGKGKLVVSTIDLEGHLDGDIARSNLRASVLEYMASDRFRPTQELTVNDIKKLFSRKVKSSINAFPEITNAALHAKADGSIITNSPGYFYKVDSKVETSGDVTAWADKRDIWLTLQCSESQDGILFLFLRNSNSSQWGYLKTPQEISGVDWVEETMVNYGDRDNYPVAAFIINDRYIETIHNFGVAGKWFALPVEASQMNVGKLTLQISTLNVPNILTAFAFAPTLPTKQ